ncbi:MAG: hypothetical protein UU09_C0046G0002 [Microgenomates group bacterium GW2011_GWA2_40_6]|nr:MAG: hypothetical protein UU09_C0046G0002 [Microgenomates group bacterium GW2011_GWA2_40_6]
MKYFGSDLNRNRKGVWKYLESLRILARRNRLNPTESEKYFWDEFLKDDRTGYRFLRQKPVSRFILDFYCSKLLLVIEIDGDIHDDRKNVDQGRDERLGELGIKTIRYSVEQVLMGNNFIENDLKKCIQDREKEIGLPFIKGRRPEG